MRQTCYRANGEGERSNLLRGSNLLYGEAGHNRFRKGRQPFNLTEYEWKGGRVVECGRLEICCTASRYREFESPPFRQKQHSERGVFLLGKNRMKFNITKKLPTQSKFPIRKIKC